MTLNGNNTLGLKTRAYVRSWEVAVPVLIVITTYSLFATYLLYNRMTLNITQFRISVKPISRLFGRHAELIRQQGKFNREQIAHLIANKGTDNKENMFATEVRNNKQLKDFRNNKQLTKVGNDKQLKEIRNDKQLKGDNNISKPLTELKEERNNKQLKGAKYDNQLTVVGNGSFYIYTIHAHQTVPGTKWDKLFVTGWELRTALQQKYTCCLKYENGTRGKAVSVYKHSWNKGIPLKARLVVCMSSSFAIEAIPKWATLVLTSESCEDKTVFHEVVYRLPEKVPSVALCGKIAYGAKDPRYLVEWVEYHKYLGVSKIVMYPYSDLNKLARKVLEYYVKEGIMETVAMPTVPLLDIYPRHFSVQNSTIMWQDEKVPLFDIEQRLRPYKYYGVIDTDEFIVPKQPGVNTLLQLMDHLLRKYPDGGTFKMMSAIHILNWDMTNQTSDLMIEQYGHHTTFVNNTAKLLHVTNRIKEGSIWIHFAEVKSGYKMIFPSPKDDVAYKHFRKCPNKWLAQFNDFRRFRDGRMDEIVRVIGPRIRHVISILGI